MVPSSSSPQEAAWLRGERETVSVMGVINAGTARLVATIGMLIATGGWGGHGIESIEHWVCWKAAVSKHRARGLVAIARRREELPVCWGLFESGRLTEDAMVRVAKRVPAERDREVAGWATAMTISQLTRVLATLPELPDPHKGPGPEPERHLRVHTGGNGWVHGSFALPPDEGAVVLLGLGAARDAEFRDRNDLGPDEPLRDIPATAPRPGVPWADALVRMASEAADGLDKTLARTGTRGERHLVVLHHDIDPDGTVSAGQLHHGPHIPDWMARYLSCDAKVQVVTYKAGSLFGISPEDRVVSRKLRRYLERRDRGCVHPLCEQTRWLHAHHLIPWPGGAKTIPSNLACLCPLHHRALHRGDFTIHGNPEDGTLVFHDSHGRRIEPPQPGPPGPATPGTFTPPTGERLDPRWFGWN